MSIREAKLKGVRGAVEAHKKLGLDRYIKEGRELVDVFAAISNLEIATLCRPLEGLLGAYYVSGTESGILITTNRRLPVQRFTAAHELGHYWLGHSFSLDSDESLGRVHQAPSTVAIQEIEAESFASEFLLPKSLLYFTARRLGWSKSDLRNPENVYQLALRTGTSYEATWRALLENRLIDPEAASKISLVTPKNSKSAVLRGVESADPWADALRLLPEDNGSHLIASPEDTVLVDLPEHSGGGFLWSPLEDHNTVEMVLNRNLDQAQSIGSVTRREMFFRGKGLQRIHLEERRPWESEKNPLTSFDIEIDFSGQERGLPRAARQ